MAAKRQKIYRNSFNPNKILENANYIAKFANESKLFENKKLTFSSFTPNETSILVNFNIDDNNFAGALYFLEENELVAHGQGVNSNLGNKTGSLLFHLQLLLATKVNVTKYTLLNCTNEPERAARHGDGIYGACLQVNKTTKDTGVSRKEWTGKTLKEQLLMSDGQMIMNQTIPKKVVDIIIKIINTRGSGDSKKFKVLASEYGFYGGAKFRKKTIKKIKKKKRKKSQKTKKMFTSTR